MSESPSSLCAVSEACTPVSGELLAQEEDPEGFADLSELPVEVSERRPTCLRCW